MKTNDVYLWASLSVSIAVLLLCFASILITPVFSQDNIDYFNLSVTIGNYQPNVTMVWLNDSTTGSIQLQAGTDTQVWCNGSIVDPNGYQDVTSSGNMSAIIWQTLNGTMTGAPDNNIKYVNSSCTEISGNGNYANISCGFVLPFYALNGTWACNFSVQDAAGYNGSNITYPNATVDLLLAVDVLNGTVSFGTMNIGESSTVGKAANISNIGNVKFNITVQANAAMSCSSLGTIGVGNISYNVTDGTRAQLAKNLTLAAVNVDNFNLSARGIITADGLNSTKNVYWGITVPTGVLGTCNNTITVTASSTPPV